MSDSNVIKLTQPGAFSDSLTEILRSGARALLTQAIEAGVAEFLAKCESAPNRDPAPAGVTTLIRCRESAEQEGLDRRRSGPHQNADNGIE